MLPRIDIERGRWVYPNSTDLETQLRTLVQDLMRESVYLGRESSNSLAYKERRAQISTLWRRFPSTATQLRSAVEKEAKQATRDALHAQLCGILRAAESKSEAVTKPYATWKAEIERVIEWLDRFTT